MYYTIFHFEHLVQESRHDKMVYIIFFTEVLFNSKRFNGVFIKMYDVITKIGIL